MRKTKTFFNVKTKIVLSEADRDKLQGLMRKILGTRSSFNRRLKKSG